MKIIRLAGGKPPVFVTTYDDDWGGWIAKCEALGVEARAPGWIDLLASCARALTALLTADETLLADLGYHVAAYATAPGHGTHYDLPFLVVLENG